MKILHSSDWHLGRMLYGRKRYDEFKAFLDWLVDTILQEEIDVLLVAGDVFDTTAPSHHAQALYYQFLCSIQGSKCRHVLVIAGNHDSPSFLNAPAELLKALNVYVVGAITEDLAEEVFVLKDKENKPELIVCAVPYLRDKDIRRVEAGEHYEDKEQKLIEGIKAHYSAVVSIAEEKRKAFGLENIPIIAMGHLFTAGGQLTEGDGVRELYVGSLAHVSATIFPCSLRYVALGHLHVPQCVSEASPLVRYSGSPLPMGFGEANQQKSVCVLELSAESETLRLLDIPCFQTLRRIKGDSETITEKIKELQTVEQSIWLEIIYEGNELVSDLATQLQALTDDTHLDILRIQNNKRIQHALSLQEVDESLDDLSLDEVFMRCLSSHEVPEEEQVLLKAAYQEIVVSLQEADTLAS